VADTELGWLFELAAFRGAQLKYHTALNTQLSDNGKTAPKIGFLLCSPRLFERPRGTPMRLLKSLFLGNSEYEVGYRSKAEGRARAVHTSPTSAASPDDTNESFWGRSGRSSFSPTLSEPSPMMVVTVLMATMVPTE